MNNESRRKRGKLLLTIAFAIGIFFIAGPFLVLVSKDIVWLLLIVVICFSILIGYFLADFCARQQKKTEEQAKREREESERKRKEEEETIKQKYALIDAQYGICTKTLLDGEIRAYEENEVLYIKGNVYKFSDLMGCEAMSPPSPASYVTTTDTGNLATRAIVGGALFGTSGALAGAVTARTQTQMAPRDFDAVIRQAFSPGHVKIYLKSISTPTFLVNCRQMDEQDICELINAIIAVTHDKKKLHTEIVNSE